MRARSTAVACNPAAGTWASLSLRRRLWLGGLGLGFLLSWAVMVLGSGCSLLIKQGPADLRYAGISLVDFADAPGGLSGQPGRKVLVVTVATNRDLGADIFDTGAIADIRARTCSPRLPVAQNRRDWPVLQGHGSRDAAARGASSLFLFDR